MHIINKVPVDSKVLTALCGFAMHGPPPLESPSCIKMYGVANGIKSEEAEW